MGFPDTHQVHALAVILWILAAAGNARAAQPIVCGETLTGEIASTSELDDYEFSVQDDESVLITAAPEPGGGTLFFPVARE